jgi:hypothetical protein
VKCWVKVGAFVALIGLLGADIGLQTVLWFGAPRPVTIETPKNPVLSEGGQKSKGAPDEGHTPLIPDTALIVGALTVLVIGYQAFVLRGQHAIMDRQVQATIASQRAFVFVNRLRPETVKGSEGNVTEFVISVLWENSGLTPTHHLLSYISGKAFGPDGVPDDYPFPDIQIGSPEGGGLVPFTLGPKGLVEGGRARIPVDKAQALIQQQSRLYIWGWCEYDDILPGLDRHRTELCYEVVMRGRVPDTVIDWRVHNKHNGADDECMHKPQPYEARLHCRLPSTE